MSNKYYDWWKKNKPFLSLVPALIFWVVSILFFMVGLRFENPVVVFGRDMGTTIAIALSLSNTIIQIIGNDQEQEDMGVALWLGWMGSYLLGVGTNVVGLLTILSIENSILEWGIALGLGTMIEVLPERLLVQFLKTFNGRAKFTPSKNFRPLTPASSNKPKNRPAGKPFPSYHPIAPAKKDDTPEWIKEAKDLMS